MVTAIINDGRDIHSISSDNVSTIQKSWQIGLNNNKYFFIYIYQMKPQSHAIEIGKMSDEVSSGLFDFLTKYLIAKKNKIDAYIDIVYNKDDESVTAKVIFEDDKTGIKYMRDYKRFE